MDYPVKRLHEELEIDNLSVIRQKSTLKMVYRGLKNKGPTSLNNMFNFYTHARSLRSENQLLLLPPKTRLKYTERDISFRGCLYRNPVPIETKQSENLESFKHKINKHGTNAIT